MIPQLSELTKDVFAKQLAKKAGVDADQLRQGIDVEREHAGTLGTSDMHVLAKIAIDHLKEKPDYYTGLKKMEKEAGDIDIAQGRTRTCKWCGNTTHKTGGYCSNMCRRDAEEDKMDVNPDNFKTEGSEERDKQIKQWNTRKAEWEKDKRKTSKRDAGMDSYLDTDDVRREQIEAPDEDDANEVSTSAAAGPYMTPKAFSGKSKWGKKHRRKIASGSGMKVIGNLDDADNI